MNMGFGLEGAASQLDGLGKRSADRPHRADGTVRFHPRDYPYRQNGLRACLPRRSQIGGLRVRNKMLWRAAQLPPFRTPVHFWKNERWLAVIPAEYVPIRPSVFRGWGSPRPCVLAKSAQLVLPSSAASGLRAIINLPAGWPGRGALGLSSLHGPQAPPGPCVN